MKSDIEDLKAVADQILLQTTLNTVKINVLTDMVLGVFKETHDENTWKTIHRNFYNILNTEVKSVYDTIDKITFEDVNQLKLSFEFQSMISAKLQELDAD